VNDGFYVIAKMLLEEAARRGGNKEVRAMLTWGDVSGNTPFHSACSHGSLHCIRLLIKAGYNTMLLFTHARTRKHTLTLLPQNNSIGQLVGLKLDIDLRNSKDQTLLYFASHSGKDVMNLLLQNGAEITNIDGVGKTPLHVCALMGNLIFCFVFILILVVLI